MGTFNQFVDKKMRDSKDHLGLLKTVLEQNGFQVKSYLDDREPYIFIHAPHRVSFAGVRVYESLGHISFRIQKEEDTHPYGRAYSLEIEDMYNDYLGDNIKDEEAAKKVMEAVTYEIKEFFEESEEAEKELRNGNFDIDRDPMDKIVMKSTGTDYSNLINSKGN